MRHAATSHESHSVHSSRSSARAPADPPGHTGPAHRRSETARLLLEAHAAEGRERSALQDQVIGLNLPVALQVAQRYHGRGIAPEDLDQVACLGLTKAARSFDPTVGTDFLSFAVPTVRGEIRRHFRDFGWTVRPPRWLQELQPRLVAAENELYQQLGRSPRPSELADHLGVELDRVLDALGASGCFAPSSLDAPAGDGEARPIDLIGAPDAGYAGAEARVTVRTLMRELTPRERTILQLRFRDGLTQAEIGKQIGVTQMQISRVLSKVLSRLRERLTADAA